MLVLWGLTILFTRLKSNWQIGIGIALLIAAFIQEYYDRKHKARVKIELLEIGSQVFASYKTEFTAFYTLYLNKRKAFINQNREALTGLNFDLKKIEPMDALYVFADNKKLTLLIDWKGEENEGEIEAFVENLISQGITWANTLKLRGTFTGDVNDGSFIIDLFKAIDKDLKAMNLRLLFFELNGDAYVFTVVPSVVFASLKTTTSKYFYSAGKLKK